VSSITNNALEPLSKLIMLKSIYALSVITWVANRLCNFLVIIGLARIICSNYLTFYAVRIF